MATCDACGTTIVFGGVKNDAYRYCNANCAQRGAMLLASNAIPDAEIEQAARALHQGNCPRCGGPGPVDVHTSHRVYSALVVTSWSSKPEICCRSCGTKSKLVNTLFSGLLGWWGFPWGIIMTPIQVGKNLGGIIGIGLPDPATPSPRLKKATRLMAVARRDASIQAAAAARASGQA